MAVLHRRLGTGRIKVWSCDIIVDWADPQEEPDEDTMARVKVLYCRNLTATVTEENLRETFERWDLPVFMILWSVQKGDERHGTFYRFGKVERVKKIKDYAFVHFEERDQAVEGWLKNRFMVNIDD